SIATTGPFAQTNNCGTSLAAGANCTVNVTFTPPSVGSQSGNVTIATNASANPSVDLKSTRLDSSDTPKPTSPTSPAQAVNATSPAHPLTLSTSPTRRSSDLSIATTGPFAQTNNCGTSLAAGANCTVNVTFTPPSVGSKSGNVTIASNASANPS